MASHIYWVKQERRLFGKGDWITTLSERVIGLHKDREEAISSAVAEAERTSVLGRTTEVWIDDGLGFTLFKAFKASKPEVEEEDDEDSAYDPEADSLI
jgi:hypothetical protein